MSTGGGYLWVFGGFGERKAIYNDFHRFDPGTGKWEVVQCKGAPKRRYLHAAAILDDTLYVHGGSVTSGPGNKISLHDSKSLLAFQLDGKSWKKIKTGGFIPSGRYGHSMTSWGDRVVIGGGCKQSSEYLDDAYVFNPKKQSWRRISNLPHSVAYHTLFAKDEALYLFGGYSGTANIGTLHRLLVGTHSTWELIKTSGEGPRPRCGCTIQVVNSAAYVFGGYTDEGHDNKLYKLDLNTMKWSGVNAVGSKPLPRAYLQSGICRGEMYVFGGYNGRACIADLCKIRVDDSMDIRGDVLYTKHTTAAALVLRHFNATSTGMLSQAQLETFIKQVQQEFASIKAETTGIEDTSRTSVFSLPSSSIEIMSSKLPTVSDTAGFTKKELEFLEQAMMMGIAKGQVIGALKQLKQEKGEVKDINHLIDRAMTISATPGKKAFSEISSKETKQKKLNGTTVNKPPSEDAEPPFELTCPLSCSLFEDPVLTDDGHTYEREMIEDWFNRGNRTSPQTNENLPSTSLRPNHAIRSLVALWKKGELK